MSSLLVFSQEVPRREQIFAFYFKVSESLERLTNLLKMIHQKHTTLLKMTPPPPKHHHYTMLSTTGIPRALEHKMVHSSNTQASKMQAGPIYISCDPQQHVVILANQI